MRQRHIDMADVVESISGRTSTIKAPRGKSRRSVSMTAQLYVRLRAAARENGVPIASLVDRVLTRFLDGNDVDVVTRDAALVELGFGNGAKSPKKARK